MRSKSRRSGNTAAAKCAIFREIEPPWAQAALPINKFATWYTWSEPFRLFLREAVPELRHLGSPRLVRLKGLDYDQTYSCPPERCTDDRLRRRFISFARSLNRSRPGRKIMLFDGLKSPDLTSKELHALFALLRGILVELAGDERAAMYSPLGQVGKQVGEFPLHSDLYVPPMLFNVFSDVAKDNSGASTFLSVATLRKLLSKLGSLPARKANTILALFEQESETDRFDKLFDLLYGRHPWARELEQAMKQRQLRIKLHSGQGYLVHDRAWLHGRDAPRGGVSVNRIRRLVFGGP